MRRLSQASLNDSSKTKLTPTATANETRSPRGRARAKMLATVPKIRPTARLPNTRRSSNSVWSTCGRSKRRREAHRIARPGRIPKRNATKKSRFDAMNRVAKERALLKRASDRLSGLTTGRMGLSSAGWVESDVDAREAGPGPVSRLRGANPSGRDGVLELRGLCHRRSRRPAQPSLRARPREGAETLRGGVPSHETTEGPRPESRPRDGRGGTPLHLHELWELRRLGRREVPPLRGGIRAGTRRDHAGGRGHPRHPPLPRLRRGLRPGNRRVRSVRGGVEGNRKTGDCCTERGPRRSARRRGRASRDGTRQSRRLPDRVRSAGHGDAATRGRAARRNATGAPAPHPHAKASGADSERAAPTATEIYTRSGPRRAETCGNARADASSDSNENQASIAPTADACGSRTPQACGPKDNRTRLRSRDDRRPECPEDPQADPTVEPDGQRKGSPKAPSNPPDLR